MTDKIDKTDNLNNLTCSELSVMKDEVSKELSQAEQGLMLIEEQEAILGKDILIKQAGRKDLQISISKGKFNIRELKRKEGLIDRAFWRVRDLR